MAIVFYCPCGKKHHVSEEYAGKKARCGRCNKRILIPELPVGPVVEIRISEVAEKPVGPREEQAEQPVPSAASQEPPPDPIENDEASEVGEQPVGPREEQAEQPVPSAAAEAPSADPVAEDHVSEVTEQLVRPREEHVEQPVSAETEEDRGSAATEPMEQPREEQVERTVSAEAEEEFEAAESSAQASEEEPKEAEEAAPSAADEEPFGDDDNDNDDKLSMLLRLDSLTTSFEDAWREGRRPVIEDCLVDAPEAERSSWLHELLILEIAYRKRNQESPLKEEYLVRFSSDADVVQSVFDLDRGDRKTDGADQETQTFRAEPEDQETQTFRPEREPSAPVHESASGNGGPYNILRPFAKGGMGQVSIARDEMLDREVALKELLDATAADALGRQRFVQEAKITGQLEHPGVVPVHALGMDRDGLPYYTMKLVQGQTLKEAIRAYHESPSPAGLRELLRRFVAVCQTMAFAHARGIVHRDLKPANIMLGAYGETLVMDWGLARSAGKNGDSAPPAENNESTSSADLTRQGEIIGTPAYMSPEQASGNNREFGPPADIYGLGAVLYHLLSGKPPYTADSALELVEKVLSGPPESPRAVHSQIPPALQAICMKAMAREKDQRYAKVQYLAADVQNYLDDEPVAAYPEPWRQRAYRWMRHHKTLTTSSLIATFCIVVGVSVTVILVHREQARRVAAEAMAAEALAEAQEKDQVADLLAKEAEAARAEAVKAVEQARIAVKESHAARARTFSLDADLRFQRGRAEEIQRLLTQANQQLADAEKRSADETQKAKTAAEKAFALEKEIAALRMEGMELRAKAEELAKRAMGAPVESPPRDQSAPIADLTQFASDRFAVESSDDRFSVLSKDAKQSRSGQPTLRLDSLSQGEVKITFPARRNADWNVGKQKYLNLAVYCDASKDDSLDDFWVRIGRGSGYFEYRPQLTLIQSSFNKWWVASIPLAGGESERGWRRTEINRSSLSGIDWMELHARCGPSGVNNWFDTPSGVKLWIDSVGFSDAALGPPPSPDLLLGSPLQTDKPYLPFESWPLVSARVDDEGRIVLRDRIPEGHPASGEPSIVAPASKPAPVPEKRTFLQNSPFQLVSFAGDAPAKEIVQNWPYLSGAYYSHEQVMEHVVDSYFAFDANGQMVSEEVVAQRLGDWTPVFVCDRSKVRYPSPAPMPVGPGPATFPALPPAPKPEKTTAVPLPVPTPLLSAAAQVAILPRSPFHLVGLSANVSAPPPCSPPCCGTKPSGLTLHLEPWMKLVAPNTMFFVVLRSSTFCQESDKEVEIIKAMRTGEAFKAMRSLGRNPLAATPAPHPPGHCMAHMKGDNEVEITYLEKAHKPIYAIKTKEICYTVSKIARVRVDDKVVEKRVFETRVKTVAYRVGYWVSETRIHAVVMDLSRLHVRRADGRPIDAAILPQLLQKYTPILDPLGGEAVSKFCLQAFKPEVLVFDYSTSESPGVEVLRKFDGARIWDERKVPANLYAFSAWNENGFGDRQLEMLKDAQSIVCLDLGATALTDEGMKHLEGFTNLRELTLDHTAVSDVGLEHLKSLGQLQYLSLKGNSNITDAGLKHLSEMKQLKYLDLEGTRITDAGLADLASLTGLGSLSLKGNSQITDAGLKRLQGMSRLGFLSLDSTGVTDAGISALGPLSELRSLELSHNPGVTDAVFKRLTPTEAGKRPDFLMLSELDIRGTKCTKARAEEFQKSHVPMHIQIKADFPVGPQPEITGPAKAPSTATLPAAPLPAGPRAPEAPSISPVPPAAGPSPPPGSPLPSAPVPSTTPAVPSGPQPAPAVSPPSPPSRAAKASPSDHNTLCQQPNRFNPLI